MQLPHTLFVRLRLSIAALFTASLLSAASAPNILIILMDDLGQQDLSCYGSSFYETPAIDALAADGMRFNQAYAAHPRCGPSRHAFQTGKFPHRLGNPGMSSNLDLDEITLGQALKDGGYSTFFAGKWHLSKSPEQQPDAMGYTINIAGGHSGAPRSFFAPYNQSQTAGHHSNEIHGLDDAPEGEYLTDRLTDETIRFLQAHAASGTKQPFFATLAHYAVHTPLQAKSEHIAYYEAKRGARGTEEFIAKDGSTKAKQDNAVYAGMIHSMDESVARILATLETLKLRENTLILFTSDHGGLSNRGATNKRKLATSNLPLRAGKGHLYEGGTRVPFIISWPGQVPSDLTSDAVINGTDVYPTLLEAAGLRLLPEQHLDGISFLDAALGKPFKRAPIIWHSPRPRPTNTGDTAASAILDGSMKLMKFYFPKRYELYDLSKDPKESNDLSKDLPEITERLAKQLEARLSADDAVAPKADWKQ